MTDDLQLFSHIQGAPLDPPQPVVRPHLPPKEDLPDDGKGTVVAVLDSGISRNEWLIGSVSRGSLPAGIEDWDLSQDVLPRWVGHGTAVAGIVLQYAPQAMILPVRILDADGEVHDHGLADAIRGLIPQDPDVLNLSLGPGRHPGNGLPPVTLQTNQAIADLQAACGTIVVVSGGYKDQPWPQEHLKDPVRLVRPRTLAESGERTLIVGALDSATRKPASFSDRRNVGIWAAGVNVSSSFVYWTGPVAQGNATQNGEAAQNGAARNGKRLSFTGWAKWSGTSFSAPAVAGAIAAAISEYSDIPDDDDRRLQGLKDVLGQAHKYGVGMFRRSIPVLAARSVLQLFEQGGGNGNGRAVRVDISVNGRPGAGS